jgi:hypothetical protein
VRSSSEQHADAQRLLWEVTKKVPEKVLRAYGSVVQAKFEYEYFYIGSGFGLVITHLGKIDVGATQVVLKDPPRSRVIGFGEKT